MADTSTSTLNANVAGPGTGIVTYNATTGALSAGGVTLIGQPSQLPVTLCQGGIPMIHQSSGSIAANGALTLTTALDQTYPNCFMYFIVNAVFSGSAAGWYYVVMSSTTLGTIYNNVYASGTPAIPASPTPIVAAGPGAYTQQTFNTNALSVVIPGGAMLTNGVIEIEMQLGCVNNANAKNPFLLWGGSGVLGIGLANTPSLEYLLKIRNQGKTNRQAYTQTFSDGQQSIAVSYLNVDTTVAQTVQFQTAVATSALDWMSIVSSRVTVRPF
jgi:hypothetical protein